MFSLVCKMNTFTTQKCNNTIKEKCFRKTEKPRESDEKKVSRHNIVAVPMVALRLSTSRERLCKRQRSSSFESSDPWDRLSSSWTVVGPKVCISKSRALTSASFLPMLPACGTRGSKCTCSEKHHANLSSCMHTGVYGEKKGWHAKCWSFMKQQLGFKSPHGVTIPLIINTWDNCHWFAHSCTHDNVQHQQMSKNLTGGGWKTKQKWETKYNLVQRKRRFCENTFSTGESHVRGHAAGMSLRIASSRCRICGVKGVVQAGGLAQTVSLGSHFATVVSVICTRIRNSWNILPHTAVPRHKFSELAKILSVFGWTKIWSLESHGLRECQSEGNCFTFFSATEITSEHPVVVAAPLSTCVVIVVHVTRVVSGL